jgi:hypothetical protein
MKLPKHIQFALLLLLLSSSFSFSQGSFESFEGSVDITAAITEDSNSTLYVIPGEVEIRRPALVTVTILGGQSQPLSGHYIELVAPGLNFNQPTQPTNEFGVVVVEVFGTNPGSFNICARDITFEGIVIDILDCDTLYVTPVPVPTLVNEPQYTKGTTNTLFWNSLGSGYEYYIEVSRDSEFNTIEQSSGWISGTMFEFQNLVNERMYFYRVKARNNFGGQSGWSNIVFSVQDDEAPEITVISIGDLGTNNTVEWESNYEVDTVYRVEDNLVLDNVTFYCVNRDGTKEECGVTTNTGVIYTTTINLGSLQRDGINNLFSNYSFCIEASDRAGNVSERCNINLTIPEWSGDEDEDEEPEPPKEVPTYVGRIIRDVIDNTKIGMDNIFRDVNDYRLQDISTGVSIATITIGFGSLIGGLLYIPIYLFQLFLNLLTWLGFRKKVSPIGYVYDSSSKDPISQAIVRVSKEDGSLVWTDVTDSKGLFGMALDDGKYSIKVSARDYGFPSKIIFGKSDYPLENVYHGEEFEIKNGVVPEFSIPLDPLELSWFRKLYISLSSRFRVFYKVISILLFIFGLIFTLYSYSKNPNWFVFVILLLYIPSFVMILFGLLKKRVKYGVVKDNDGNPIKGLSVGLRDMEYERITAKRITDGEGRYRFVVNNGKYELEVLETGYEVLSIEESEDRVLSDGSLLIAKDIVVKPVVVEK